MLPTPLSQLSMVGKNLYLLLLQIYLFKVHLPLSLLPLLPLPYLNSRQPQHLNFPLFPNTLPLLLITLLSLVYSLRTERFSESHPC